MANPVSTLATDVTAPVNVVLMRGLLRAAERNFPYLNGTMPGTLEKHQGSMTVKWRRINNLEPATTALGEVTGDAVFGMGRTAVNPTITDLTVAIAKYGNFINYTEELDLINVNSRAAQLMDKLGENAGHSLNALMRAVMDAETTARYAGGVATTTLTIAPFGANDIRWAVNYLNRNSAMKFFSQGTGSTNVNTSTIRSSYFGICHSDVEEDIRAIPGFIGVEQYGGYTETFTSEFGAVNGVRFSSSEIGPIGAGAAVTSVTGMRGSAVNANDVYSTFIYGREAIGSVGLGQEHLASIYKGEDGAPPASVEVINHPVGSSGVADPLNEVGSIGWKSWFAGKVLNSGWFVKVQSLSASL